MNLDPRLQDDLLRQFTEERKLLAEQIAVLDPLGVTLRKPAAQRLMSNGGILFLEILCWMTALAAIPVAIFMKRLYPFFHLYRMKETSSSNSPLSPQDAGLLYWTVMGLILLIGFMFFLLARTLRRVRQKNAILSLAGRDIKSVVAQHLQRKAALDAIAQRNYIDMPEVASANIKVNDIPNPGF